MITVKLKKQEADLIKNVLKGYDISGDIQVRYKVSDKDATNARRIITKLLDVDENYYYADYETN
jgi:hypothetical protein